MGLRFFSSIAAKSELTNQVSGGTTTLSVSTTSGFPASTPYTLIIDRDTPSEELVEVSSVSGLNLTVVRGVDGSTPTSHNTGASVEHGFSARDLREPNEHIDASQDVHGVGVSSSVVGTNTSQVLKNKTIDSSDNTLTVDQSDVTGLVGDLATLGSKADVSYVDNSVGSVVPIGTVLPFAGSSAPAGFVLCDGQALDRTTFNGLYNVIGVTYGSGDGSTTFNVPDLTGRVPAGKASSGIFDTLGDSVGAKSYTLTVSKLPSHSHSMSHTHGPGDFMVTPYFKFSKAANGSGDWHSNGLNASIAMGNNASTRMSNTVTNNIIGMTYYLPVTGTNGSGTTTGPSNANTGSTGSGSPYDVIQPSLVLNYMIRSS